MTWLEKIAGVGWSERPDDQDIRDALDHLSDHVQELSDFELVPIGMIPIEQIPDDLSSWLETEASSIGIPSTEQEWSNLVLYLNQETSSRNFQPIINAFRNGSLSPVIIHREYGVLDGRGRVNFANALGIPIMAIELTHN